MHSQRGRQWLLLLVPFLLAFLLTAAASFAEESTVETKINLPLPGGAIRVDVFEQPGTKQRPAILVLHGAGGTVFDGPEMRRVSRDLANDGNAVYLLHYFNRTGTLFARDAVLHRHFPEWLQTVRDAVPAIQGLRGDSAPVGIYGYSLGGFLALFTATDNLRVGAVVEHAGGAWNGKLDRIGKMPPVLMVHGERDGRVPFAKYAEPLLPVLRKRAAVVETRFFPEEGHSFSAASMVQVRPAATKFFSKHLRQR